jgi:beta-glucosidase-like glycosyl hydrolase
VRYVKGLQGALGKATPFLKTMAIPKHFVAYSLEEADGENR